MNDVGPRTRDCDKATRAGRMAKAEDFLDVAEQEQIVGDENRAGDVLVTLFVHAGIAAADVICCSRLGVHAQGENHQDAVALLRSADEPSARDLAALLRLKTKAACSPNSVTSAEVAKAARAANHLLETARGLRG